VLKDLETGQTVLLRADHSLFWIRMEYWGIGLALVPVLMAL
jgi:hypothetical protein